MKACEGVKDPLHLACVRALRFAGLGLLEDRIAIGLQKGACAVGSHSWLPVDVITFCR